MDYWQGYWRVYGAGLRKSTGEQVIGGLLAVAIVVYQIHYGIITRDQTSGAYWSIAWPYLILVGGLLLWHLVQTPAEMDAAIRAELTSSKSREEALSSRLREIEEAKPKIVLNDPGAKYSDQVGVNHNGVQVLVADVVRVRFANKPQGHYPNSEARRVIAKVSFYDPSGILLLEDMDGRWADSTQPVGPHWQSVVPLLETDFRIGAAHDLDIAFRDPLHPGFVALNNDNFRFQRWRKPEHVLGSDHITAKIRLNAVWVNEEFSVEFWVAPNGSIETA